MRRRIGLCMPQDTGQVVDACMIMPNRLGHTEDQAAASTRFPGTARPARYMVWSSVRHSRGRTGQATDTLEYK